MPPLNITSMNNQDLVPGTRQRADQHLCTDWQLFVGDIVAFREGHGWHQVTQVRRRKCSQELGVSLRCLQTGQTIRKIWTASGFVATWGVVPAIFAPVAAADNASVKLHFVTHANYPRVGCGVSDVHPLVWCPWGCFVTHHQTRAHVCIPGGVVFPRSGVMWRAGPNRFGPAPGLSNPCAAHPGLNRGHWPTVKPHTNV